MTELEVLPDDDRDFVFLAKQIIVRSATVNEQTNVAIIHIKNWFGERWLGFHGKFLGAAGVRSRSLTKNLILPPFNPNRVLSQEGYALNEHQTLEETRTLYLHTNRASSENLDNVINERGIYAWYSSNSANNKKASLMIYNVDTVNSFAWYARFSKNDKWTVEHKHGINDNNWKALF